MTIPGFKNSISTINRSHCKDLNTKTLVNPNCGIRIGFATKNQVLDFDCLSAWTLYIF
jgi:hypothetical protein